jgi:hypothetical protein
MPYAKLSHAMIQRIQDLRAVARAYAHDGHAAVSNAYTGAAEALRRNDEIGAQLWLEEADAARFALRPCA